MKRSVQFYRTEDGKCYIEKFLDSLPAKTSQKVTWVLNLIEELDYVPDKFFKKLTGTDDIWECRIKVKSDIFRILCFFHKDKVVILTHGFQKKTQKTPREEIEKAEILKKDYLRRFK